jgi:two-component system cell cycle response regulator
MENQLEQLIMRANMGGGQVSLLIADLDKFKSVNDTYGHDAGDEVLQEFSRRIEKDIRPTDVACRYGGEEFVVIMPETSIQMAQIMADRLRQTVEATPFRVHGGTQEINITMSGGVSVTIPPDDNSHQLIKRADEALYKAKQNGRNRIITNFVGFSS